MSLHFYNFSGIIVANIVKGGTIMDEMQGKNERPVNPRRRPKSQMEIFKEAYLPVIIAGTALLLIIIFVIGSIVRGVQHRKYDKQVSLAASASAAEEKARLDAEAQELMITAAAFAEQFDYDNAIATLEAFSGNMQDYTVMAENHAKYLAAKDALVLWNDPGKVLNLSFHPLIVDSERAFSDPVYSTSYNKNFVTVSEFQKILQQLYENGYILVSMSDITDGTAPRDLYLPNGKKPLILTETNINYYYYMVDSDDDHLPDQGGAGFASKLVLDANGNLSCEMVDSTGETLTGNFDIVPILNAFIETHPDFSYKGAKAILATTGSEGIFGYRTNETMYDEAYRQKEADQLADVLQALQDDGYEIACYTYDNIPYGERTLDQIRADLDKWDAEVAPLLGDTNILVYAQKSDISDSTAAYSGEKFNLLQSYGFTHYLGFCTEGTPWFTALNDHVRQGRILVSGSSLKYHADWFNGIIDPSSVLDSTRGSIPQ